MSRPTPRTAANLLVAFASIGLCWSSYSCSKTTELEPSRALEAASDVEARELGILLERALVACDTKALLDLVDVNAIARRAVIDSSIAKAGHAWALKLLTSDMEAIAKSMCRLQAKVVRVTGANVLFRVAGENNLDYVDYHVGRNTSGKVVADSVYSYQSALSLSEQSTQALDQHVTNDIALSSIEATLAADPTTALADLKSLHSALLDTKRVQLLIVHAAILSDAEQGNPNPGSAAIATYRTRFPNDPSIELLLLGVLAQAEDFAGMLTAIDKLDAAVGTDDYLNRIRVDILLQQKTDLARATKLAEQVLLEAPEDEDAHYSLFAVHLANRNFGGSIGVMLLLGQRFGVVFDAFSMRPNDKDFQALLASSEWAAYQARTR